MTSRTIRWLTVCPGGEALHVARIQGTPGPHWRLHRHDFFECFLVESGLVGHRLEGGSEELAAGDFVFVRPEHEHGFSNATPGFSMVNLAFRVDVASGFLRRRSEADPLWKIGGSPLRRRLPGSVLHGLVEEIDKLASGGRDAIDAEFALCLAVRAARAISGSGGSPLAGGGLPDWLCQALPLLEEPEVLREGVPAVVRTCGRGPEHVSRSFRKYLGATPTAWINSARIRHACRLLETTRLTILEIALECGFESPSRFHRLFRSATESTPLRFRNRSGQISGFSL
jgi:AraC family cel operon transcriptional repressor